MPGWRRFYGRPPATGPAGRQVFLAAFDADLPSDVGGAGSYARFATPLGTLWTYTERFRGHADLGPGKEQLESDLAGQRAAADHLVDLISGWLQQEIGQDPAFPRLRQFLDKDLRANLKGLLLLGWAHHVSSAGNVGDEELAARGVQYLIERGYLTMTDVPAVARLELSNDSRRLLALAQRLLARKMGVSDREPIPASLGFLSDPNRAGKAFASYVAKTEFFQKRLEAWKQRQAGKPAAKTAAAPGAVAAPPAAPAQPDADDPEPTPDGILMDLLDDMIGDWLDLQTMSAPDTLSVKLHCGVEPLVSNGEWDEEAKTVGWSAELKTRRLLPQFCFAVWCRPNEAAQKEHFGGLVLEGEDLAEYAMWYCGLTRGEAQEWDRFVATLRAGGNWKAALEKFRFTSDPKPDPANPKTSESLADEPRALILGDGSEDQPAPLLDRRRARRQQHRARRPRLAGRSLPPAAVPPRSPIMPIQPPPRGGRGVLRGGVG